MSKAGELHIVRPAPVGQRFGRLVVLAETDRAPAPRPGAQRHRMLLCACDCGQQKAIHMFNITRGLSLSCGCLLEERAFSPEAQAKKRAKWAAKRLAASEVA